MSNKTWEELLERDKDKIADIARNRGGVKVSSGIDPEWLTLAELGAEYGYTVIEAVRNNNMSADDMRSLLKATRQLRAMDRFERLIDLRMALASIHSKESGKAFQKHIKEIYESWQ